MSHIGVHVVDADPADSAVRDFVSGVITPWTVEQNNQAMSSGLRYRFEFNAGMSGLSNGDSIDLCFDFSNDESIREPDCGSRFTRLTRKNPHLGQVCSGTSLRRNLCTRVTYTHRLV